MIVNLKIEKSFDLDKTLDCGQCFRWYKKLDSWFGVVNGYIAKVKIENNFLKVESGLCDKDFWRSYFDLEFDYEALDPYFSKFGSILMNAADENRGIHILNQNPWEALCSFIISQNNNIPRIKLIISRFCEYFGEKLNGIYSFPDYKVIAKLKAEDLSPIKAGFRSKYMIDAARRIFNLEVDLEKIKIMNTSDALCALQKINGVGPKVAACTMLYGFHRFDCFPVDVWIKKVIDKYFKNRDIDFGKYRGLAQIYLFNWSRSHPEFFK